MRLKIEEGCGIRDSLKARYWMKIGRRDRDTLRFEGGIGVGTGIGELIKSIYLLLKQAYSICPCKLRLTCLNNSVVRPVFSVLAANVYTKLHGIFGFLARVTIFLSGVCLSEHFFLYGMIGSLRISLSNGCCCPKCRLLIRIFCKVWRFGTVG